MIILFQNIRFVKELVDLVMAVLGYLPKLNRGLGLAFGEHFLHGFLTKLTSFNVISFFLLKILLLSYYQDTIIKILLYSH